ncbi:MAG: DUF2249 domain-containing protein [Candidatus Dormibacteria bacterium]
MGELKFEVRTRWANQGAQAIGSLETGGQVVAWSVPGSMGGAGEGTSPEELLAAAVGTCYTATLGSLLTQAALPWDRTTVSIEETVTSSAQEPMRISRLVVSPVVGGADATRMERYQRTAKLAQKHCFIGSHLHPQVSYEVGEVRLSGEATAEGQLDVRAIPPSQRHQLIFSSLDRLGEGQSLTLVNDHDPLPLRYQLEATRAGQFEWAYLESGPRTWKVHIGRQLE